MEPRQPDDLHTASHKSSPVSLGQAMFIIVITLFALLTLVAFSPAPEIENQSAAAAAALEVFSGVAIEAKSAIVIDIPSGKVLYEKNADVQLPIASLTKVMLALAVAEALPADSLITIPYYASGAGSNAHLLKGQQWRISDVVDFTLVESSNNGADILADAANDAVHSLYPESPKEKATLWRMNALARTLNLSQTYFLNVNGLDLSTTQAGAYGSARDMASLFAYAASAQPSLFAGTSQDGVLLTTPDGAQASASNTNEAQGAIPGLMLGKTGFTDLAGGNLGVVFDVGLSHPMVAIVLGSSSQGRFKDIQELVRRAGQSLKTE